MMNQLNFPSRYKILNQNKVPSLLNRFHLDPILLLLILLLIGIGLFILFSASNQNIRTLEKQAVHLVLGLVIMLVCAYIPPKYYKDWTPWIFVLGLSLLIMVLLFGRVGKGAQRWLHLGFFDLQPSEIMKIAMPMMLAYYFSNKTLPPKLLHVLIAVFVLALPVLLTAKQPDLGTAILIATSGLSVLFFAGLRWIWVIICCSLGALSTPLLWFYLMHDYQKERVLTFLNPESDPLGSGYHIIQSKIAIGSGGISGKGWLHGTQSHLQFLPAHTTDFIFAVNSEESGLIGCFILLIIFLSIFLRSLYISSHAHDTFSRLLGSSLSLTFIVSAFINVGMVMGILPVVGVPLPLISYGGSAIITTMATFGIIMSICTHKKLWNT